MGIHCFEEQAYGRLLFTGDYTNRESLLTWLMSFQDRVVLLEPAALRREIGEILLRMQKNYRTQVDEPQE
mgnify:FL=1